MVCCCLLLGVVACCWACVFVVFFVCMCVLLFFLWFNGCRVLLFVLGYCSLLLSPVVNLGCCVCVCVLSRFFFCY